MRAGLAALAACLTLVWATPGSADELIKDFARDNRRPMLDSGPEAILAQAIGQCWMLDMATRVVTGSCTCGLIALDQIVTARHCLTSRDWCKGSGERRWIRVAFARGRAGHYQDEGAHRVSAQISPDRDCADRVTLRIWPPAPEGTPVLTIARGSPVGKELSIPQYGRWSGAVSDDLDTPRTIATGCWANADPDQTGVFGVLACSAQTGSSGAPIVAWDPAEGRWETYGVVSQVARDPRTAVPYMIYGVRVSP